MDPQNIITELTDIVEELEQLKGYWDETGLDMHIAVKSNQQIVISTKHWWRVNYIQTNLNSIECWNKLGELANLFGRKLIKKDKTVYINKLNETQTQEIFDKLLNIRML